MQPDRREIPLADFLAEAWEMLGEIEAHSGAAPESAEARRALAVLLHRLKGSAALYGLPAVSRLAAALESRLADPEDCEEALAAGVDWLRSTFEAVERDGVGGEGDLTGLVERFPELAEVESGGGDPVRRELLGFAARDAEVLGDFLFEAEGYVDGVAASLSGEDPDETPDADGALRRLHTLKGTAYMVGCEPVGRLADAMEEALQEAAADGVGPELEAALGEATGVLRRMLDALAGGTAQGLRGDLRRALARLAEPAPPAPPAPPPKPVPRKPAPPKAAAQAGPKAPRAVIPVAVDRLDRVVGQVGELAVARGRFEGRLGEMETVRDQLEAIRRRMLGTVREFQDKYLDPRPGPVTGEGAGAPGDRYSEAGLDRYDDFNLLARRVGEVESDLEEVQAEIDRLTGRVRRDVDRLGKLTQGLLQGVTRVRLVPVDRLLARFERLATGLARQEGKEVRLEIDESGVELDTAVAQEIGEPLLHLARNAVSHGLETPEDRCAADKPETGTLALRAYPEGRFVHLEVEDDGRGLDPELLTRRAVELGLLAEDEAASLERKEVLELVFQPGFSTRTEVTAGAGRGVGMDAVRDAVARLHGEIQLETETGVGTRVTLRVPLTQVVSEALWLAAGGRRFLLPTLAVRTLLHVERDDARTPDGELGSLSHEGEDLPLVSLARSLGLPEQPADGPYTVVVVRVVESSFGLVADDVLGVREVMVQGLGELLAPLGHLAGAAVSAAGGVVLLLDPLAFAPGGRLASHEPVAAPAPVPEERGTSVLLVDDSLSVRKILARRLGRLGFEVTTAQDGEEALELLRQGDFDALVTDLEMPRMNGYELIESVRRRPATRELPVVVITTRAGREHGDLAHRLGAHRYLTKPVDHDTLGDLLRDLVAGGGASSPAGEAG